MMMMVDFSRRETKQPRRLRFAQN
jgi:hypothetical protein